MDAIRLWNNETIASSLTPFLLTDGLPHAAVLVIPGGGYGTVCETTEGSPVARAFNRRGFHAFVLDYRVAPARFPAPLEDAVRAVRLIRSRAAEWHVIPDRIASCGFSAGGHLAGSLGVLPDGLAAKAGDAADAEDGRVDAMILCYAVLCFGDDCHRGSAANLTGGDPVLLRHCSLEKQDLRDTPPAFVWATAADPIVDCRNSIRFFEAMRAAGRPCELHVYPYGTHGMLLGLDTPDVGDWPDAAARFLDVQWTLRDTGGQPMERYTNAYQAAAETRDAAPDCTGCQQENRDIY